MNIHFIIHEDFEAPGAYMEWAKEAKHQVSATRLYLGEQLPSSSDDFDMDSVIRDDGKKKEFDNLNDAYAYYKTLQIEKAE